MLPTFCSITASFSEPCGTADSQFLVCSRLLNPFCMLRRYPQNAVHTLLDDAVFFKLFSLCRTFLNTVILFPPTAGHPQLSAQPTRPASPHRFPIMCAHASYSIRELSRSCQNQDLSAAKQYSIATGRSHLWVTPFLISTSIPPKTVFHHFRRGGFLAGSADLRTRTPRSE